MKKILFLILIPCFCFSQRVTVSPFYLSSNERMCLSVTIENNSKNNFYFFQKLFEFKLYQVNGKRKIPFDKEYYEIERNSIYAFYIQRYKKPTKELEQLQAHLIKLKDNYIKAKFIDNTCNLINQKDDIVINWYNSFIDNILFIPVGGKVSFLTTPITVSEYTKGEYVFVSNYIEKDVNKFHVEDYDNCLKKVINYWYVPQQYNGFISVKSMPSHQFRISIK